MEQETDKSLGTEEILAYLNSLPEQLRLKKKVVKNDYRVLFWVIQKFLRISSPQPPHLDEIDELIADQLRPQGFTMEDLGWILDRASSSIHDHFKRGSQVVEVKNLAISPTSE